MQVRMIEPQVRVATGAPMASDSVPIQSSARSRAATTPPAASTAPQPSAPSTLPVSAMTVVTVAPALDLYTTQGGIKLRDTTLAPAANPDTFPSHSRLSDPLRHRDPLPYASTRFEKTWRPRDETLGDALLRKVTVSHTWRTHAGTQISCTWLLIVGGCGWGLAPRATAEELKRMRADPPMPNPSAANGVSTAIPEP